MTYFHRCTSTIIGAKAFHGPVRDGKGWDRLAMVVKRSLLSARAVDGPVEGVDHGARALQSGKKHAERDWLIASGVESSSNTARAQLMLLGVGMDREDPVKPDSLLNHDIYDICLYGTCCYNPTRG